MIIKGNYSSICVKNGKIYLDGKLYEEDELKDKNFDGNIIIEGTVRNIDAVNVTVNGKVSGDIDATTITVYGNVCGNIDGTTVEVGGDIGGDIDATTINVYGTNKIKNC